MPHKIDMPYLRGTYTKWQKQLLAADAKRPTLAGKVKRLEYEVRKIAPEKQYFLHPETFNQIAGGIYVSDLAITREFVDAAVFRNFITGDKWRNHWIEIQFKPNVYVDCIRCVVYCAKRGGTSLNTWGTGTGAFVNQPDPTGFTLYADRTFRPPHGTSEPHYRMSVRLNNLTEYNSEADVIDRNNVRVAFIYEMASAGDLYTTYKLCLTNK